MIYNIRVNVPWDGIFGEDKVMIEASRHFLMLEYLRI